MRRTNLLFGQNFPVNCMKTKDNGPGGGRRGWKMEVFISEALPKVMEKFWIRPWNGLNSQGDASCFMKRSFPAPRLRVCLCWRPFVGRRTTCLLDRVNRRKNKRFQMTIEFLSTLTMLAILSLLARWESAYWLIRGSMVFGEYVLEFLWQVGCYFRLQWLVGICFHKMLSWRHASQRCERSMRQHRIFVFQFMLRLSCDYMTH